MIEIPIVTRRDMLGESCLLCEEGRYRLNRFSDDVVVCTACECESAVDRWLTKREILQVQSTQNNNEEYEDDK